jgi:hypothetical protein
MVLALLLLAKSEEATVEQALLAPVLKDLLPQHFKTIFYSADNPLASHVLHLIVV